MAMRRPASSIMVSGGNPLFSTHRSLPEIAARFDVAMLRYDHELTQFDRAVN